MKRSNVAKEEEMQHRHVMEKKRLPKILKQESKTRSLMFKQSLRLSVAGNPEDERAKMKQVKFFFCQFQAFHVREDLLQDNSY